MKTVFKGATRRLALVVTAAALAVGGFAATSTGDASAEPNFGTCVSSGAITPGLHGELFGTFPGFYGPYAPSGFNDYGTVAPFGKGKLPFDILINCSVV
jgi:hypothetical protein